MGKKNALGYKHTPEALEKIREASKKPRPGLKGRPAHNKGKPMTEEQKAKLSAVRRGVKPTSEAQAKRTAGIKANYANGYTMSPESRAKVGAKHKDKFVSEETRKKIGQAGKGRKPPITGKHHTPESKAKMRVKSLAYWESMTEEQKAAKLKTLHESTKDIIHSSIEEIYAQRLDDEGVIYERQKMIGWYKIDFYIPDQNKIIEIQGCYWHDCEQCGHAGKHKGKKEADEKRHAYLRKKGYAVEIIWEHDLPRNRT